MVRQGRHMSESYPHRCRWLSAAAGYAVIPSSTKRANLQGDFQAQQLCLTYADMAQIATLYRSKRVVNLSGLAPEWS